MLTVFAKSPVAGDPSLFYFGVTLLRLIFFKFYDSATNSHFVICMKTDFCHRHIPTWKNEKLRDLQDLSQILSQLGRLRLRPAGR